MSNAISIALSTWDDVDAHLPAIVQAVGPESDAGKALVAIRDDVNRAKRTFLQNESTIDTVLHTVEAAFKFALPFVPPPVGEAVEIALRVIESAAEQLTLEQVDVVIEPEHKGAPPATVDGVE